MKKYKIKIVSTFEGLIEGVPIKDEMLFNSVVRFLDDLLELFPNVVVNQTLVNAYTEVYNSYCYKEYFETDEFESLITQVIQHIGLYGDIRTFERHFLYDSQLIEDFKELLLHSVGLKDRLVVFRQKRNTRFVLNVFDLLSKRDVGDLIELVELYDPSIKGLEFEEVLDRLLIGIVKDLSAEKLGLSKE